MKKPVVLRIYKGEQLLGARQFMDPQIVFGRTMPDSEAQVTLDGDSVSLIHASIEEREEGKYFVCDLGSVGGTKVNGQSVLDGPIDSGDVLEIGDYRIEFYIGAPKPKTGQTVVGYQLPKTEQTTVAPAPSAPPAPAPAAPAAPAAAAPPPPPVIEPAPVAPKPPPVAPPPPPPVAPPAPPVAPPPPAPTPVAAPPPPPPPAPTPVPPAPKAPPPPPPAAAAPPPAAPAVPPPAAKAPTPNVVPMTPPPPSPFKPSPIPRTPPPAARPPMPQPGAGAGMAGVSAGKSHGDHAKRKNKKTFAPPSRFQDVRDYIKPSKGTVIEVLVAWRERIIATYHFSQAQTVTMGSHPDNDIVLPLLNMQVRKLPILKIDKQAIVLVGADMQGEVIRGQTSSSFSDLRRQNRLNGPGLPLDQGEMVRIELSDQVSLIIRYVSDSPKPLIAPILDFTAAETTGVVLALALVATLWLTMSIYHPAGDLAPESEEPMRTAQIVLTPPTPPPLPKVEPPPPEPEPPKPPPPVPTPPPPPKKVKVEVSNKTQEQKTSQKAVTNLTKKNDPGKSANAAPNKNKTGPRQLTSPKQGGAIKTSKVEGSQMKSKNRDMSKSGIFSAFANGGQNDQLAQSATGSGELAGMADSATGKAGSAVDRAGKGLGSDLKDTGAGGTGTALKGIVGGVGTTGRGSGNTGYGTGGLGTHQGTKIVTGGSGEMIKGTIDREAIRRVILANLKSIRACYEKELNRHPELYGKLVLGWDIGEQGRVLAARVKSNELGNRDVAECILAKLKTWRFPDPPANQVVEIEAYPFLFSN